MAKKSQFECRFQTCSPGFLLIECLIALMIATALVMFIQVGYKKIIEGQVSIIKEFRAVQQASTFLHEFLSSHGIVRKKQVESFNSTMSPCSVEIISCDPQVSWLSKKNVPIIPIKLVIDWRVGNKKHLLNFFTVALAQGA